MYVENIIRDQKFSGACSGHFNHAIIIRDLGLADKKEVDLPGGGIVQVNNTWSVQPVKPAPREDG